MAIFKQWFPTLFIPVIFLGVGCTQPVPRDIEPAVDEEVQVQEEVSTDIFEDGTYTLDVQESTLAWNAQKRVGAKHNGTVEIQEGAFVVEQGQVVGGTVVADMATIVDLDLTDEEFNTLLTNHLKSDDFFAVETYPTATFAISEVTELEGSVDATHTVTGTMTIKGVEHEVSFPALFVRADEGIQVDGVVTLDRTLWDIRFGSDKFFDNLGDGLIEDEFTLTFNLLFVATE